MRVLITGSRTWSDYGEIQYRLEKLNEDLNNQSQKGFTLVSGACPDGADRMAETIAAYLGWTVELHPADWERLGRKAGFVRNAEMVRTGADICLAFIHNGSRGASMTAELAQKSGIPTEVYKAFD
jgi:hypothetical protein